VPEVCRVAARWLAPKDPGPGGQRRRRARMDRRAVRIASDKSFEPCEGENSSTADEDDALERIERSIEGRIRSLGIEIRRADHLSFGDFLLRRDGQLGARLHARCAASTELRGPERRQHRELECTYSDRTFDHE